MTMRHRDTNLTRCRKSWRERSEGEASSLLLDRSSLISQFHKVVGKFYLLENLGIVLGTTMGEIFFNLRPSPNIRPFFLGNFQLISYPIVYNQVCYQFRDFVEIRETTQMIKFYLNCYQDFFFFGLQSGLLEKKRRQWSKHRPRRENIFQIHNDYKVAHNSFPHRYFPTKRKLLVLVSVTFQSWS